ncbi:M1 family metallopeptidase [Nonlabens sp. Hel1_33_55]|uniref:M1 family metallopeptidase n=1 Tax=Nonlabens sp. Hel1_33_55 TaxID=1336802 RepID=UPI0012FD5B1D|nr:M1 family metallopeptidase [Nonlabens sp. Hel1_33_55]
MRFLFVLLFFAFLSTQNYAQGIDQPNVDFLKATVNISMDPSAKSVDGSVTFDIDILSAVDKIQIDAKNLVEFTASSTTHSDLKYSQNDAGILLESRFRESEKTTITISFKSEPNKAMYFIDSDADGRWEQAWTQGQGKYTSNWLPSIDDMNEKLEWDLTVTAPDDLSVISNGILVNKNGEKDRMTWSYDMTEPMSSYLVALVIGKYAIATSLSESGVPLEMYYYPKDEQKVESTYQNSKQIFDFLENEIGIAYPWKNYKQIPVKDFLYAGMENTGTTIFDDQFVQDKLGAVDRSYVTVNAHELAHQWFGDLVTEESGTHHWLQEGFATYYAMLAERDLYGDEHYHVGLYEQAELLNDQNQSGKSTALMDPTASSLTFYQHGAWAIHALRDLIGDTAFRSGIKRYLKEFAFKNATTDNLLSIMSQESGKDLTAYKSMWLTNTQFPSTEALRLLRKDLFMEAYLQLLARRISPFQDAYNSYKETMQPPVQKEMVLEMVGQLSLQDDSRKYRLLEQAAAINNIEIRQLIALTAGEVNDYNKVMISGMLTDKSYATRENALVLLWNAATDKARLLKAAKKGWSTTNESLDMAWLTLAINSDGFTDRERTSYLGQLQEFTKPQYSTSTRQTAFDYLIALGYLDDQNYLDLYTAALHYNYRFYDYARKLVNAQYAKEANKELMEKVVGLLGQKDQEKLRLVTDL